MKVMKFIGSNIVYIIWFLLYFTIAWAILGANWTSFMIVSVIYGISVTIALSPIGEGILRFTEGCRLPTTEEEYNYLMPLFEEVYDNARELNPTLSSDIKLYITDDMYVNAFAMGRNTVAVTRGAMATLTADELKGVLAHELGHITHGHTKALLLAVVGNFFFSIIVWIFRILLNIVQFFANLSANFNVVGIAFAVITFITRVFADLSILLFVNLSQIILAINSRTNEIQADTFAYEIGYGRELISAMYLLQKITMGQKVSLSDRLKASHPHIAYRIRQLEILEDMGIITLQDMA